MKRSTYGCVALSVTFFSTSASAADLWVAPGGSDSAAGSSAAPWATLQHAADTAKGGDTVHVKDGSYTGFHVDQGGTQTAPIVFVADGTAALITQRNAQTQDGINVENADWITIDGFVVNGMPRAGVRCALSTHVTVRRVHADANTTWGIFSGFCDDLVVEDNVASHSVEQHGVYVSNSAQRPIVRRNVIFGNNMCGLHMNGDKSMGGTGTINGALVEQNVIYENGKNGGSSINGDGVSDSIIRNNLVYAAHASGLSLYQIDASAPGKNNQILHNTIVVAADGRWALNIVNGSTDNTAKYNVLLNLNPGHGAFNMDAESLPGLTSDYNVVTPKFTADDGNTMLALAGWQALGFDTHSVAGDQTVFAGAASGDYHLAAGSSPIDHAVGSTLTSDIEGHLRPFGTAPDIGCYEWGSTATAPDAGSPFVDAGSGGTNNDGSTAAGSGGAGGGGPSGAGGGGRAGAGGAAGTAGGSIGIGATGPIGAGDASAGANAETPAAEASGCGCRFAGQRSAATLGWLVAALALSGLRRRPRQADGVGR